MVINRILAVQLADIGDLILATPALGALRASFPTARIDLLTKPHAAPIVQGTGLIDEVLLFDKFNMDRPRDFLNLASWQAGLSLARRLRAGRYDAILFLRQLTTRLGTWRYLLLALASGAPIRAGLDNGRGWFLTHKVADQGFGTKHQADYLLAVAAAIGAKTDQARLWVGISPADHEWAAAHVPNQPFAVIHPGTGTLNPARQWEAEKFAQAADWLHEQRGYAIVIVGGPADRSEEVIKPMRATPINLTGQTTLNQLAAVLARCSHYLGADSGIMHLAAATAPVSAPLQALFGPTNHNAWRPWGRGQIYRSGALCSPCSYIDHAVGLRAGCEARTCMKMIAAQAVMKQTPGDSEPGGIFVPKGVKTPFPSLKILGVTVHSLTFADLLAQIERWIGAAGAHQICTVNPEFIMTAQSDPNFFNILNRAALCIPDGVGLIWAAKRLGRPLPERVTGSDSLPMIAERAAKESWKLFFLGAMPGIADKAAEVLTARYPGLKVVGTYPGTPSGSEEDKIVDMINATEADILFVAYGAPNQDKWIARNLPRLRVRVAMGVGGAFDFIAGITVRAPLWMRRAGIEWLHRLIQQPWRWRRMMRLPRFALAVLQQKSAGPEE